MGTLTSRDYTGSILSVNTGRRVIAGVVLSAVSLLMRLVLLHHDRQPPRRGSGRELTRPEPDTHSAAPAGYSSWLDPIPGIARGVA